MAHNRFKGYDMDTLRNALAITGGSFPRRGRRVNIAKESSTCSSGKVCYPTVEDAIKALKIIKSKHFGGGSVKWYQCPECGFYHTSSNRSDYRKRG